MDSEWVQQAVAMNGSDDEKNKLDLELQLGLPNHEENPPKNWGQHFDPTVSATNNHVDSSHFALSPQGKKDNHAAHEGVHTNVGAWPLQLGIHDYYANPIEHGTSSSTRIDLPLNRPPGFPGLSAMIGNNLFVDISQIRNMESGASSSSGGPVRRRRQGRDDTDNPNKRCTNLLCNATTSPQWRRGPLGLNTLCNACGIKYKKEEEKRRIRVIMQQLHELATARHKPAS